MKDICPVCAEIMRDDDTLFLVGNTWVCSESCAAAKQGIQSPFGSRHTNTDPDPHPRRT